MARSLQVLLMAALVALAAVPPSSGDAPTQPDDPLYVDEWTTPEAHFGDIWIGFTVDLGADNDCTIDAEVASPRPTRNVYYDILMGGLFRFMTGDGQTVQIQHGAVDSRAVTGPPGGAVGGQIHWAGPTSGVHDARVVIFDAGAMVFQSEPFAGLAYRIACVKPFWVDDRSGGTELIGFTQQDFDGTHASAAAPYPAPHMSTNLDGTIEKTFHGSDIRMYWDSYVLIQHGRLSISSVTQSSEWSLGDTFSGSFTGGPGHYRVDLDRVGAGWPDLIVGVVHGGGPVDHFDDLL